jgi:HEAT repeat protein
LGVILGEALAKWLSDEEGQRRTAAAIETSAAVLRQSPFLTGLKSALPAAASAGAAEALAVAREFLGKTHEIEAALRPIIQAARSDPYYRPPLKPVSGPVREGLLLLDHPALSILLALVRPDTLAAKRTQRMGPASITFGGQQTLFRFLQAGGAILSFWEAPQIGSAFTAAASGRCRLAGRRRIADGECFRLDGRRESFVIDHAVSDIVYLQAATPLEAAPLSVEYDSSTLAFAAASSTDEAASRVQMMLTLLRLLERSDAAPLFGEALRSPHFYVRWHAMRELLALDAGSALPDLRAMAEGDPHPDVRAAAAQTLEAFFPASRSAAAEEAEPCLA